MEPLMSAPEVAAALNVSVKTVRNWHGLGKGPRSAKVGKGLRYRPADVRQFIDEAFSAA